jgi:hypothetical protein
MWLVSFTLVGIQMKILQQERTVKIKVNAQDRCNAKGWKVTVLDADKYFYFTIIPIRVTK